MSNIYQSGEYLESTQTWHSEDSPWKAEQILRILTKNAIRPNHVVELGCGAGVILQELSQKASLQDVQFEGYDISPQAIQLSESIQADNIQFFCEDLLALEDKTFDLLLAIDVFEHVPDYLGFLESCRDKAEYKLYHIPLDIHVSSIIRNALTRGRYSLGHLHYFTADTALSTLEDTGHEIIDFCYTNGALGLFRWHPSFKTAVVNGPRWLFSKFSTPLTARFLGGYSLLVLTK